MITSKDKPISEAIKPRLYKGKRIYKLQDGFMVLGINDNDDHKFPTKEGA